MDERCHRRRRLFLTYNEPNRIHLSNKSVNLMPHRYAKSNQFYKTILHISHISEIKYPPYYFSFKIKINRL